MSLSSWSGLLIATTTFASVKRKPCFASKGNFTSLACLVKIIFKTIDNYYTNCYNPKDVKSRNCWSETRQSEAIRIPFEFKLKIPKPRKGTIIKERNNFGRIVSSQHL